MSQTHTAVSVNNFNAPISYNKYLPTNLRELKVSRESEESYEIGSDVLQAVAHVVRVNPVDPSLDVNSKKKAPGKRRQTVMAKNITFRGRDYRVIWSSKSPLVEIYEMSTGNGYIFDVKRGVVV